MDDVTTDCYTSERVLCIVLSCICCPDFCFADSSRSSDNSVIKSSGKQLIQTDLLMNMLLRQSLHSFAVTDAKENMIEHLKIHYDITLICRKSRIRKLELKPGQ
jgi:hypothetical protein